MSDYKGSNIFEKIGAFIPGYKGYSEKEGRRDTDKLLRIEIAKCLDNKKDDINHFILQQIDKKNFENINALDRIKRKLDLLGNKIRYTNYGESGFFDVVQVDIEDLDQLYKFDLEIKGEIDHLVSMINGLKQSEGLKESCSSIMEIISALNSKMESRDKVITEVV